jgi:hypothetical protein
MGEETPPKELDGTESQNLCRVKRLHGNRIYSTLSDHETPLKELDDTDGKRPVVSRGSTERKEKTPSFQRSHVGSRDSTELKAQWGNVEVQSCGGLRDFTERK